MEALLRRQLLWRQGPELVRGEGGKQRLHQLGASGQAMRRHSIATTALMSSLLLVSSLSGADGAASGTQHIYVLGGSDPRVQPKGQVAAFTPPAGPTGNGTWAPVESPVPPTSSGTASSGWSTCARPRPRPPTWAASSPPRRRRACAR